MYLRLMLRLINSARSIQPRVIEFLPLQSDLKGGFELRPPIAAFVAVPCDNHGRYAESRWHIGIIDIGLVISELVVAPDRRSGA